VENIFERIHRFETGSCDEKAAMIQPTAWLSIDPAVIKSCDKLAYQDAFIRAAKTANWDWSALTSD